MICCDGVGDLVFANSEYSIRSCTEAQPVFLIHEHGAGSAAGERRELSDVGRTNGLPDVAYCF